MNYLFVLLFAKVIEPCSSTQHDIMNTVANFSMAIKLNATASFSMTLSVPATVSIKTFKRHQNGMETVGFANSVDPDEAAQNELPDLDQHCTLSCL